MQALLISARRDTSIKGRKESRITVLGRQLIPQDGVLSIGPSIELEARVRHLIPTRAVHASLRVQDLVEEGKHQIEKMYPSYAETVRDIVLYGPFPVGNGHVRYQLAMPHLPTTIQIMCFGDPFQSASPHNAITQVINRRLAIPYSIAEYEDGRITKIARPADVGLLLRGTSVTFDEETHNWQTLRIMTDLAELTNETIDAMYEATHDTHHKILERMTRRDKERALEDVANLARDERVTILAAEYGEEGVLFTTLDAGTDTIMVDVNGKSTRYRIVRLNDTREIQSAFEQYVATHDPLEIVGYNHQKFDIMKIGEITGERLRIGTQGRKARIVSGSNFLMYLDVPGRVVRDPFPYHQHRGKTVNNKLATVAHDVLGIPTQKDMTHAEVAIMTRIAEESQDATERQKSAHKLLTYCAKDVMITGQIADAEREEHYRLARFHASPCSRINTVSLRKLIEDDWTRWHVERYGNYPQKNVSRTDSCEGAWNAFDSAAWVARQLQTHHKHDRFFSPEQGLKEGHLIAFFPLTRFYAQEMNAHPRFQELLAFISQDSDPKRRTRMNQDLEAYAEWPIFQMIADSPGPLQLVDRVSPEADRAYSRWFGGSALLKKHIDAWHEFLTKVQGDFRGMNVINRSDFLYVVLSEALDTIPTGAVYLGRGRFLSGNPGRFVALIDGQYISPGIMDFASQKGDRNSYTREFSTGFIDRALVQDDAAGALAFVDEQCKRFWNDAADLTYTRTLRRDPHHFSRRAQAGYVDIVARMDARSGDEVQYHYEKDELASKYFGIQTDAREAQLKRHEQYLNELAHWEQHQKEGGSLFPKPEAVEKPQQHEGFLRELVMMRFPVDYGSAEAQALHEILSGRGTAEHHRILTER